MVVIFFFLFKVWAVLGEYNYDRCDLVSGPLISIAWTYATGSKCGSSLAPQSEGSPINLCGASAFSGTAPTFTVSSYDTASYSVLRTMNASNSGHSFYLTVLSNAPTMQLGNVAYLVGRSALSTYHDQWILQQVHFHWGRTGLVNEGSEHYMQGVAYPMEAHLVHYNSKYTSFSAAVASNATEALLVIGVFLAIGSVDLNIVSTLASSIPSLSETPTPLSTQVSVSDLFNGTGPYYAYRGSLTTPLCNEVVTWVVMKDPKPITLATLNKFKNANLGASTMTTYGTFGNYRPLQPLNSRTLFSSNGSTASCTTFTQAQGACNTTGAAAFTRPSALVQFVALALILVVKCA